MLREARDLTVKCLTFSLKFESSGTLDVADGGYESTVSSEITLRFDPEQTLTFALSEVVPGSYESSKSRSRSSN